VKHRSASSRAGRNVPIMTVKWPQGTRGSALLLTLALIPILAIAIITILSHID
jgi:hypothetical protein